MLTLLDLRFLQIAQQRRRRPRISHLHVRHPFGALQTSPYL